MSTLRTDVRTRARDYFYESSADIISDAQLNRLISEEVQSLPGQDVYLEEIWTTSLVVDQYDYTLPSGTQKVERVERNDGTASKPDWNLVASWDNYAGALHLGYRPSNTDTIRVFIKKAFTTPSDDTTALDVPDDKAEIVVWGVVIRMYRVMIGYIRQGKTYASVTAPGGVTLSTVQQYLRDAETHYKELIKNYQTQPRPRDIDLTG